MSADLSDALNRAAASSRRATPTASSQSRKGLLLRLPLEMHKRLRLLAVERDTTVQALGLEALDILLSRYD